MFHLTATLFPDAVTAPRRPGPLAPLQQSPLHASAVRLLGGRTRYLELPGTGAWLIERRLQVMGEVALISRGPAMLPPAAARALHAASGARHLIVNAEDDATAEALAMAGFWRIAAPRKVADLALHPCPGTMAKAMTGKWRNRLRHALNGGLAVRRSCFPPDPRHWLLRAEARAAPRLGYRPLPPAMIAALAAAAPGAAQLFTARAPAGPVAAMLFVRHGRAATYQVGWSTEAGRAASAGNLLMWRAMLALQAMGVDRIDLGLADPVNAAGLTHFKRGTGATLRSLGGTWIASAALPGRRRTWAPGRALSPRPRATGGRVPAAPREPRGR